MAKIKNTKTELKAQRDALARYRRFLPMLQLKKQQLQMEISQISARIEEVSAAEKNARENVRPWRSLFAALPDETQLVSLENVDTDDGNIAGVVIPIYKSISVKRAKIDPFETPAWYDDAALAIESLLALRAERGVLEEQRRLITAELHTTSQRVNLFEKVKIPECRENIRVINIHLGDEQTSAVARGKIAKKRGPAA